MVVRWACVSVLLFALPLSSASAQVQAPPPVTPPAAATQVPVVQTPAQAVAATPTGEVVDYTFSSGTGMLLFHVDPAKVSEFDAVVARLVAAFKGTQSQSRQIQVANWKIFKSAEKSADAVLYVFLFDPALEKVSYDPILYLAEVAPAEAQPLFERMKSAVLRVERLGLTKIR